MLLPVCAIHFGTHVSQLSSPAPSTATVLQHAGEQCFGAVTIVYGFLMVAAGARFVGPLGLSLMWSIYHALAPWLLLYYSILPFQHEVVEQKCWYLTGRALFNTLCNVAFVMSFGCFFVAVVLAFLSQQTFNKSKNSGVPVSPPNWLSVGDVFKNL